MTHDPQRPHAKRPQAQRRPHAPSPRRYRAGHLALCLTLLALVLILTAACGGERLELVGVVERTSLELTAPVTEELEELPHAVGSSVDKGDVVASLRSEVAELEVEATRALHSAAEANLAAAEAEFKRAEGLRRARVSTPQELDDARRARDEAVALLAERAARRTQTERQLEDLTMRATAAGVVDQLPYEVGERVPLGGVVAVILADEAPWVRLWLPARAVGRLKPGDPARVTVTGLEDSFEGRVVEIAREPEYTPHYALTERERAHLVYETRVVLDGAPADLRPGLPATVRLRLADR